MIIQSFILAMVVLFFFILWIMDSINEVEWYIILGCIIFLVLFYVIYYRYRYTGDYSRRSFQAKIQSCAASDVALRKKLQDIEQQLKERGEQCNSNILNTCVNYAKSLPDKGIADQLQDMIAKRPLNESLNMCNILANTKTK